LVDSDKGGSLLGLDNLRAKIRLDGSFLLLFQQQT